MMITVYISFFILISYIVSVVWILGVPESVSRTFFSIRHKWIFSAVIATSFGLLMNAFMDILPDMWQWLGFLTCAGGLFVAFAPNLEDELQAQTHTGGAVMLGLASQGVAAVLNPWLLMIWICWIPLSFSDSRIFWAEIIGGLILFLSVCL